MTEKRDQYVYALFAGNQTNPCYIGVGKGNRMRLHIRRVKCGDARGSSERKFRTLAACIKRGILIHERILYANLTRLEAYEIEVSLIKQYGRRDLHTGCLLNAVAGGAGGKDWSEKAKEKLRQFHTGRIVSDETKQKISAANKGRVMSNEARLKMKNAKRNWKPPLGRMEKMRLANLGRPCSSETRAKIAAANIGRVVPLEQRKAQSIKMKGRPGKKHSQEAKDKISRSHKGRQFTPEHRANISRARIGCTHTSEAKAKIGAYWKGKKRPPETIARMKVAQARRKTDGKSNVQLNLI